MTTQNRVRVPAARRPASGGPHDGHTPKTDRAAGQVSGAGRAGRPRRRGERGSATAELAVAMPALVLMLLAGLTAVRAVTVKLECVDAAREAARAEARGDPGLTAGTRAAPSGATVTVAPDGDLVRATVRARVLPLGKHLPGFTVSAQAFAEPEEGVAP